MENTIIAADTRFAFKLIAELARQNGRANIFISPTSIALALAMTYNGARGKTQRAMAEVLEFGGMSLPEINQANARLRAALDRRDPGATLAIANSLWARRGIPFDPAFMRQNAEYYGAEIAELDFADPSASSIINDWVRQNTGGKIDRIVDRIDGAAILLLLNAIYFKGRWAQPFDPARTKPGLFALLDGRKKQLPMMSQSGEFEYYESRDFQAISLPYADGRLSMEIFLPDRRGGLASFQKTLHSANWDAWIRQLRPMEGTIVLPRFRLEYEVLLNQALATLGMGGAFDARHADFSGMVAGESPPIQIDQVRHKTFVEVNEEGTEAAAVTSVTMTLAMFAPTKTFSMVVDRPFFCAIRDRTTGAVLFVGLIVEPG